MVDNIRATFQLSGSRLGGAEALVSMPQYIRIAMSQLSPGLGQHYCATTLAPGTRVLSGGLCMGWTLSWIRRLHLGHSICNEPSPVEAALLQSAYQFGNQTRLATAPPGEQLERRAISQAIWLFQTIRMLGLVARPPLRLTPMALMQCFAVQCDAAIAAPLKTFLVIVGRHALGLAICDGTIAVFDSNIGIARFQQRDAADVDTLTDLLERIAQCYEAEVFTVVELKS